MARLISRMRLYLSNFGKKPARIVALRVHGSAGASFDTTVEGDPLKASFIALGSGDHLKPQDPVLAPGASGMLFVFLNFGSRQAPSVLDNAMVVEPDGDASDAQLIPLAPLNIQKPRLLRPSTLPYPAIDGLLQTVPPTLRYIGARLSCWMARPGRPSVTRSIG